jgi:hypothetical protein
MLLSVTPLLDVELVTALPLKFATALKDGLENTVKPLSATLLVKMEEYATDLTPAIAPRFHGLETTVKSLSALLLAKMTVFAKLLVFATALGSLDGTELTALMVSALNLANTEDAAPLTLVTASTLGMLVPYVK